MRLALACLLASASQFVLGKPTTTSQSPLTLHNNQHDAFLSSVTQQGVPAAKGLTSFIAASLSDSQRKDLMIKLWEQLDVVDVMKMTGHGWGLEEERLVQVFGEEQPRVQVNHKFEHDGC
jgi:bacterial leucyl aminopeptidase